MSRDNLICVFLLILLFIALQFHQLSTQSSFDEFGPPSANDFGPFGPPSAAVTLNVFYLLPLMTGFPYSKQNIYPALSLAKKDALEKYQLTFNYQIYSPSDWSKQYDLSSFDNCESDDTKLEKVIGHLAEAFNFDLVGVLIGPPCRLEFSTAAQMAASHHLMILTGGAELISTMSDFATAVRISYSAMYIWEGLVQYFIQQKWSNIFVIFDDSPPENPVDNNEMLSYANGLLDLLRLYGLISSYVRHNGDEGIIQFNLERFQKTARIAVIIATRVVLRNYMLKANGINMCNGDYAYVGLDTFKNKILDDSLGWKDGDDFDMDAKRAFESLLIVSLADYTASPRHKDFERRVNNEFAMLQKEEYDTFVLHQSDQIVQEELADLPPLSGNAIHYTAAYYDAMMLLASGAAVVNTYKQPILRLIAQDGKESYDTLFTTMLLKAVTEDIYFEGVTGPVIFDQNRTRCQDMSILDMQDTKTGSFSVVVKYSCATRENRAAAVVQWPDEKTPVNLPECGYEGNEGPCAPIEASFFMKIAVCCVAVTFSIAVGLLYRNKVQKEERLARDWIVKSEDIKHPRDIQDWLKRRYTLLDDGAGGTAVADAIRSAKKTVSERMKNIGTEKLLDGVAANRAVLKPVRNKTHGVYAKTPVTIKICAKKVVEITPDVVRQVNELRNLKMSENVMKFIGACVEWKNVAILYEFCAKGTLQDLLASTNIELDWTMRLTIIANLLRGLAHIHNSSLEAHGRLTSKCCYLDSRYVLKIGDHGLPSFFVLNYTETEELKETDKIWNMLLWTAPEHLGELLYEDASQFPKPDKMEERRKSNVKTLPQQVLSTRQRLITAFSRQLYTSSDQLPPALKAGTKPGDIFSFAIILTEIIFIAKPYSMFPGLTSKEIVMRVKDRLSGKPPFRPLVTEADCCHKALYELLPSCWAHQYNQRPSVNVLRANMKDLSYATGMDSNTSSVMEIILCQLEKTISGLMATIDKKTEIVEAEKAKSFSLFAQILPRNIAERLRNEERIAPETFDIVTILFCEMANFQEALQDCEPSDMVNLATDIFNYYGTIIANYDCITLDYCNTLAFIASGLPIRNGILNAKEIAGAALTLLFTTVKFKMRHKTKERLQLCLAINTGPVVAGIVGAQKPKYYVLGETVYVARRIIAETKAQTIRCSSTSQNLMETFGSFVLTQTDDIFIKGKGMCHSYYLCGQTANPVMQRLEADFAVAFPETNCFQ